MELLYLWIKEYKGLKDVGINLSNQYRFQYYPQEKILDVNPEENYIPGFFGENITNFTGIIGENGSGKTTILKYLMQYFSSGNKNIDRDGVFVFRKQQKLYYYSNNELEVYAFKNQYSVTRLYEIDEFKESNTIIFLSNYFDPTSRYSFDFTKEQSGDTQNLSTNFLLEKEVQKPKKYQEEYKLFYAFKLHIDAFAAQEFIRIVKLLRWISNKEEQRNPFPAKLPPYINLSLNFNEGLPNSERKKSLQEKLLEVYNPGRYKRKKFLLNVFFAGIFHLMDEGEFLSNSNASYYYENIDSLIIEHINLIKEKGNSISKDLLEIIAKLRRNDKWRAQTRKLLGIQEFIEQLSNYLDKGLGKINANETAFSISVADANISSLITLLERFYEVDKISDYADFYFSHLPFGESSLSSGEYSLLSLFGRLNAISLDREKRSLLILIDEAELALHPEWQKRFISLLSEFIQERFRNFSLQIILTSHSPFILSDLPSNCVVLLKKDGVSPSVLNSLESKNETFGANIHELFTDSFFLKDGLMGEFSRRKIEELIEDIKQEDDNSVTLEIYKDKYRPRIDMIGEQFLKTKILELVASKGDYATVDSIIERRTKELDILNQIREQKAYDQNRKSKS